MRELKFFTCCPDDTYYTWQVHLWLESLKKLGKSKDAVVLLYIPTKREKNGKWEKIVNLYPEATFQFYRDAKDEITSKFIRTYIPVLRPWLMTKWFKDNPEDNKKAIFYCDSDILFTEDFNIDKYVDDDINYLSDTNSYINVDYFDNKIKDVLPEKQEEYKQLDIVSMLGSIIGITRQQAEDYKDHSGGAQYLMKDLDAAFWEKVQRDCIVIKVYLQNINKQFFENESKGFQSWCADMWAVLWNLWFRGSTTKVVKEMDFTWATDPIEKLETTTIMHNAGITGPYMGDMPCFYKGTYHTGKDPLLDPHFENVLNNDKAKKKCTWFYANTLKQLEEKYNLKY